MKINKRLFDSLKREPNEVQLVDGKKLEIYFMTEEEKIRFENEGRYSMWSSDGKDYKFLVNDEFYNYGVIKEFYTESVNAKWIAYIEVISKYQRKILYALMLPLMLAYIIVAVLAIALFPNYALYALIGMLIVVFVVNGIQSKIVRTRMEEENDKTQLAIQEHLTVELYDQIAKEQNEFREMKNKEREAQFEKEQTREEKLTEETPEENLVEEKPEVKEETEVEKDEVDEPNV